MLVSPSLSARPGRKCKWNHALLTGIKLQNISSFQQDCGHCHCYIILPTLTFNFELMTEFTCYLVFLRHTITTKQELHKK